MSEIKKLEPKKDITQELKLLQSRTFKKLKQVESELKSSGYRTKSGLSATVYLLIDCSDSMNEGAKLPQAKAGAIDFARDAIVKGYAVGIIKFAERASVVQNETMDLSLIEERVKRFTTGPYTNIADAIKLATEKLADKHGLKAMVLLTDGEACVPDYYLVGEGEPDDYYGEGEYSNDICGFARPDSRVKKQILRYAEKAKKSGIEIICIGTDDANQELLRQIATRNDLASHVKREEISYTLKKAVAFLPPPC